MCVYKCLNLEEDIAKYPTFVVRMLNNTSIGQSLQLLAYNARQEYKPLCPSGAVNYIF